MKPLTPTQKRDIGKLHEDNMRILIKDKLPDVCREITRCAELGEYKLEDVLSAAYYALPVHENPKRAKLAQRELDEMLPDRPDLIKLASDIAELDFALRDWLERQYVMHAEPNDFALRRHAKLSEDTLLKGLNRALGSECGGREHLEAMKLQLGNAWQSKVDASEVPHITAGKRVVHSVSLKELKEGLQPQVMNLCMGLIQGRLIEMRSNVARVAISRGVSFRDINRVSRVYTAANDGADDPDIYGHAKLAGALGSAKVAAEAQLHDSLMTLVLCYAENLLACRFRNGLPADLVSEHDKDIANMREIVKEVLVDTGGLGKLQAGQQLSFFEQRLNSFADEYMAAGRGR